MTGGGDPFYLKFWVKVTAVERNGTDLDDLERRNSFYFAFFTEFDCFAGQLRHSG